MIVDTLKNFLASRARQVPCTTLVLHSTAGSSLSGALAALRDRDLSYHYLIEKDGRVTKAVPSRRVAFHAGTSTGPNGPSVNNYSIGVAFVNRNDGVDPITDAQYASLEKLISQLVGSGDFPDLEWITTHYAITLNRQGRARKTDPRGLDLKKFNYHPLKPWKPSWAFRIAL